MLIPLLLDIKLQVFLLISVFYPQANFLVIPKSTALYSCEYARSIVTVAAVYEWLREVVRLDFIDFSFSLPFSISCAPLLCSATLSSLWCFLWGCDPYPSTLALGLEHSIMTIWFYVVSHSTPSRISFRFAFSLPATRTIPCCSLLFYAP